MFILWGGTSGEKSFGIVAERCPRCGTVGPCLVTGQTQGIHIYFVTLAESISRAFATCASCHLSFECQAWRYPFILPPSEVASLSTGELLTKTNPELRVRIDREKLLSRFDGDETFEAARLSVESLRSGKLRDRLWAGLAGWERLKGRERIDLAREAGELALALKFAESVSSRVPSNAGCLIALVVCLAVWSALAWAPEVRKNLPLAVGTGFLGIIAGGGIQQAIFGRRMRRWVNDVLIPEGKKSGVAFPRLLDLIDNLPHPGPRNDDVLRHLKEGIDLIRKELAATGLATPGKPLDTQPDLA